MALMASVKMVISHMLLVLVLLKYWGEGGGWRGMQTADETILYVLINLATVYSKNEIVWGFFFDNWNHYSHHIIDHASNWNMGSSGMFPKTENPVLSLMSLHFSQALPMDEPLVTSKRYTKHTTILISLWETLMNKNCRILQWQSQNA